MAMVASRERRLSPPGAAVQAGPQVDAGKYVRYTPEQVEALERVYSECPKPSSLRRQQLIRDCPILSNIEPKQIKVWIQNRRCGMAAKGSQTKTPQARASQVVAAAARVGVGDEADAAAMRPRQRGSGSARKR